MATFSSAIFNWAEVEVRVAGRVVTGIQAVRYDDETQKEFVYGAGTEPLAIKEGNRSVQGSLTLLQAELEVLSAASPQGRIGKLKNATIQVVFADGLGNLVTKSINGVSFTREGFDAQQGQTALTTEVPFMALGVVTS